MAGPAVDLCMGPAKPETRILIVIKAIGAPFLERDMAALALGLLHPLELTAMNVGVTGRTVAGSLPILQDFVCLTGLWMALDATGLCMAPALEEAAHPLVPVIVDPEGGKVVGVTGRAVIGCNFSIKLDSVRIDMTDAAGCRSALELPASGCRLYLVTLDAGHGPVPIKQRIGCWMVGWAEGRRHETFYGVTGCTGGIAFRELPVVRIGVASGALIGATAVACFSRIRKTFSIGFAFRSMAFAAFHLRMCTLQDESKVVVIGHINPPFTERPFNIGTFMTSHAVLLQGPVKAVRALMTVRTGLAPDRPEGQLSIILR